MNRPFSRRLPKYGIGIAIALLLIFGLTRCSTVSYLSQAVGGHLKIMCARKPISKIKDGQLDAASLNKLKMVLQVRAFASDELGLPRNKSYTLFSEIKGKYLGWNVYSAPEFSVEPKLWCFPIVGCVVYRGYFSEKKASAFAGKMRKEGLDVYVGGFSAYSTLGWFKDPILSTQLRMDSIDLAGLIFHELAHQQYYKPGDSNFSESFAMTVERAGVLRWLNSLGREDQMALAVKGWEEEDQRAEEILRVRAQLGILYASHADTTLMLQKKDSLFGELKQYLFKDKRPDIILNNAFIAPISAYYSMIPQFQVLLQECGGDFREFYRRVKEMGEGAKGKRQKAKIRSKG